MPLTMEKSQHGPVRLTARGEVDLSTASALRQALEDAADRGGQVTLDLTGVTFLDSTGMGVLVAVHERLEHRGGHLELVVAPRLTRLLTDAGLATLLTTT